MQISTSIIFYTFFESLTLTVRVQGVQVAIILMNLLAGPPLFRAAVIASGEARFGVGRTESAGELDSKDHERPPFEFDHRPPYALNPTPLKSKAFEFDHPAPVRSQP